MDALTTWLQVYGSYGHSTGSQTPYLTHVSVALLTFQSPPKLHYFSQYSSPLTPQFSAGAMNLFYNKRQND